MRPRISLWQTQIGKPFGGPFYPHFICIYFSRFSFHVACSCQKLCIGVHQYREHLWLGADSNTATNGREMLTDRQRERGKSHSRNGTRETDKHMRGDDNGIHWPLPFPVEESSTFSSAPIPNIQHTTQPTLHCLSASLCTAHRAHVRGRWICMFRTSSLCSDALMITEKPIPGSQRSLFMNTQSRRHKLLSISNKSVMSSSKCSTEELRGSWCCHNVDIIVHLIWES